MILFLEICVEHRKTFHAKDGLFQYKLLALNSSVASLEKVLKFYLSKAEERAEQAWAATRDAATAVAKAATAATSDSTSAAAANAAAAAAGDAAANAAATSMRQAINTADGVVAMKTVDVEDLDEAETPETVMLAAVTDEGIQQRAERATLIPWITFLWEAYRTVLDMLRNNSKVEQLYHSTARQAFNFCLRFDRRREFHRLCDALKHHFEAMQLPSKYPNPVDLRQPETLRMHVETRFELVTTAGRLNLWQEAFKGMEAISQLVKVSGRDPPVRIKVQFFRKMAQIFWRSQDYVFHAVAWHKFFLLVLQEQRELKLKSDGG